MNDHISYQNKESCLSIDRMNVIVNNYYPEYSFKDKEIMKKQIESKLFRVFSNMDTSNKVKEDNNV